MSALSLGAEVAVHCMTYHNPSSINGPFGDFKMVTDTSGDVSGAMTLNLLFGLPQKAVMTLSGSCAGDDPHVCTITGMGYVSQIGHPPRKIELGMTLTMDAAWHKGSLVFTQGMPETESGLPVMGVPCT